MCLRLEARYGSPRHGNPTDPVDDLVFIILSNRTSATIAKAAFRELKARIGSWEKLLRLGEGELTQILTPTGLSAKRSAHLRGIIRRLIADFGAPSLGALARWTVEDAEEYLVSLPGVSHKVAKCVLMYTLDRQVLPVDVHVHRITRRLGWHTHKRADQSHETLEQLVAPPLRYGFHVNCIAHGRAVCRPGLPLCALCVIKADCNYYEAGSPAKEAPLRVEQHEALRVAESPALYDRRQ